MRPIPQTIQTQLALLLAAWRDDGAPWVRVGEVHARYRQLMLSSPTTAVFDEQMDDLISRRYLNTDDSRVDLSDWGRDCLFSMGEAAAANVESRAAYDRFTVRGWQKLLQFAARLPTRYGARRGDYFVYVVLLDHQVQRLRRFREANRSRQVGYPAYYVGMSSNRPLQRFRNHKRGHKSSRYVRTYGLCLTPEQYAHLNPLDRVGAQRMEEELAADLRGQGYGVMGVYDARILDRAEYAEAEG